MARHRPLENIDFVSKYDQLRIASIPQQEFELAALKVVMFYDNGHLELGRYLSMLRLMREFSDEIADRYMIYGNDESNAAHMRAMVAGRLGTELKKLLDEQKQKNT